MLLDVLLRVADPTDLLGVLVRESPCRTLPEAHDETTRSSESALRSSTNAASGLHLPPRRRRAARRRSSLGARTSACANRSPPPLRDRFSIPQARLAPGPRQVSTSPRGASIRPRGGSSTAHRDGEDAVHELPGPQTRNASSTASSMMRPPALARHTQKPKTCGRNVASTRPSARSGTRARAPRSRRSSVFPVSDPRHDLPGERRGLLGEARPEHPRVHASCGSPRVKSTSKSTWSARRRAGCRQAAGLPHGRATAALSAIADEPATGRPLGHDDGPAERARARQPCGDHRHAVHAEERSRGVRSSSL